MAKHDQTAASRPTSTFSSCLMNYFGYIMSYCSASQDLLSWTASKVWDFKQKHRTRLKKNEYMIPGNFHLQHQIKRWRPRIAALHCTHQERQDAFQIDNFLLFCALVSLYLNVNIWLEHQRISFCGVSIQLSWQ